jgi:hypothetical protein
MRKGQFPRSFTDKVANAKDKKWIGQILTPAEVAAANQVKEEATLHAQIQSLLSRRDIPYIHASMCKRSTLRVGWPDMSFGWRGHAFAWELKVGKAEPRPEQLTMMAKLEACGWLVSVVRSLEQAQRILDDYP